MNRRSLWQLASRFAAVAIVVVLWVPQTIKAQTAAPTPPAKKLPIPPPRKKAVTPPAKPGTAAAPQGSNQNGTTQNTGTQKTEAQKAEERKTEERKAKERKAEEQRKAGNTGSTTASGTSATSAAQTATGLAQTAPASSNLAGTPVNSLTPTTPSVTNSPDTRTPVTAQGVGNFTWPGGWTLTAYSCYRTGTRLFCDFDTTNSNNQQAGPGIWSGPASVNLVDDGGKITPRHNAFFVGADGSQFTNAYVSDQPVRFVMEYDDIDPRYNSVALVLGRTRIQGVPVTAMDANQPAGKMPARGVATAQAPGTQQTGQQGQNGVLNRANNAVNSVNNQGQKAQDIRKSLQGTVQSH